MIRTHRTGCKCRRPGCAQEDPGWREQDFFLKVSEDPLDNYKERHGNVWPELLEALRRRGWRNFSLFL
jgi:L-rhamnose mutarotase